MSLSKLSLSLSVSLALSLSTYIYIYLYVFHTSLSMSLCPSDMRTKYNTSRSPARLSEKQRSSSWIPTADTGVCIVIKVSLMQGGSQRESQRERERGREAIERGRELLQSPQSTPMVLLQDQTLAACIKVMKQGVMVDTLTHWGPAIVMAVMEGFPGPFLFCNTL